MSLNQLGRPISLDRRTIIETPVAVTSYADAVDLVEQWASNGDSRTVIAANVHVVMEAHEDEAFQQVVRRADLVTPDGVPLVWALRMMGAREATRVYGPDLMEHLCARAAARKIPIALFGSSPDVVERLVDALKRENPDIRVAYAVSPPFRALDPEEERAYVEEINGSGARILFVGLGCPKQEKWIDRQRGQILMPMLAVGAAFDFLAGTKGQAPAVMQRFGLEWLFRLFQEPRRLWRRYLIYNPRYVFLLLKQLSAAYFIRSGN